ncbi:hypothetical protein GHT06_011308 [Daphnia sinensis]|uniref:RRM domain-containing protein n=1 Tax=Daphnia sinensis TaxID=1820382 RepID=A0AAD5L2I7_9CRUS|nr:hypothetical protein GHT06_011308 [Daphnia sinensis]
MSNPYAFIGLPLGSQASGSSNAGPMTLGHNHIALGGLPFSALMSSAGQGMPGLPFTMQSAALSLGLGGMLANNQRISGVNCGPEGLSRQNPQENDNLTENGKEKERHLNQSGSSIRDRREDKYRESRKRMRSNSVPCESDDDIMVLSNSPSSNEPSEQRDNAQPNSVWENTTVPMGLGFSMNNPSLVNSSMYSADASSFMAAMGPQMPFDFGLLPGMGNVSHPSKEPIHLKSCILYPPNPQAPLPTTRERPLGCKTVFVGGLAENITEDILREIFERCGSILTIRMSKKNFAHVRFERECYVDAAILLSGYRVRLHNQKPDANNPSTSNTSSGRLHVDFAQARDDQYEYECQARRLERELRHRQRIEEDKWRPPSPPPVPHYAEHEAHVVVEQLKNEERFGRAVQILATWLERGDCSKRNSNGFYSMIQSAHAHLRRLGSEKSQLEEEARRTHDSLRQKFLHLTSQLGEMERLFQAASHQKAWDHFTKAQRKSLESWKKHVMDIKLEPTVEFLTSSKDDDNMEFSDSESDEPRRYKSNASEKSIAHLKEENDSLRCQLEAYKNEVEIVRSDLKLELQVKEQHVKNLERNLAEERLRSVKEKQSSSSVQSVNSAEVTGSVTDEQSIKLISLLSVFLSVQHCGTTLDEAYEYVRKSDESCTKDEVEKVLLHNKELFSHTSDLWRFKLFFH